jgi:hypothetical protein
MRYARLLLSTLVLSTAAVPAIAQNGDESTPRTEAETEDFVRDVIGGLFRPNWNIYMSGGAASHGRFLLQRMATPASGERAVRSEDAFTVGVGAGVDVLLRSAFRVSYTFSESDLQYRTDDGDGSTQLDAGDLGLLQRHVAAVEVLRYMFPARSPLTPYASAGLVAAWWLLDEDSPLASPSADASQFRIGALATFGLQVQLTPNSGARFEVATSSIRNPFTGSDSYRAQGGVTIDEPTRVSQTDFRLAAVYYFAGPDRRRNEAPAGAR